MQKGWREVTFPRYPRYPSTRYIDRAGTTFTGAADTIGSLQGGNRMKTISVISALALTSCSTIQTQYVGPAGQYGSGKITGGVMSMNNGKFSIGANGVTCSGNFPSWKKLTIVFPVWCTDGASGTVTMTRPPVNVIAGEGTMQLTNGETRRFTFG